MLKMINVGVTIEGDNGSVEILKDINLRFEEKKFML